MGKRGAERRGVRDFGFPLIGLLSLGQVRPNTICTVIHYRSIRTFKSYILIFPVEL